MYIRIRYVFLLENHSNDCIHLSKNKKLLNIHTKQVLTVKKFEIQLTSTIMYRILNLQNINVYSYIESINTLIFHQILLYYNNMLAKSIKALLFDELYK